MSTLADLVRAHTELRQPELDWLHRLVAQWQLVADLAFADLVLWVRTRDGDWLAAAHLRPTTGPTAHPQDVVGSVLRPGQEAQVEAAWTLGRIVHGGDPVQRAGRAPVRQDAVPVSRDGRVVAVLSRETDPGTARLLGSLELAYLTSAGELLQMISEGTFPYPGSEGAPDDREHAPRAGDGLLRLDRTGHVVYASPNAQSAYRRLGLTGDLLGLHLGRTVSRLATAPPGAGESAALASALRLHRTTEAEVEGAGATVLMRAMPLVPGGEPRGALVLVRDVSELRRRDRQILGKDATIREIHHRVKNNLQTVAALLRMQARRLDQPAARAALEESVRRVSSIATVHETLSLTLDEAVPFDEIADRVLAMCAELRGPGSELTLTRVGHFGDLGAAVATPLAMVLTELVQNAVEHGFPADAAGTIEVRVRRGATALAVEVVDDGVGLPLGFTLTETKQLGLQIVRTLCEAELGAALTLVPGPHGGTQAAMVIPLPR